MYVFMYVNKTPNEYKNETIAKLDWEPLQIIYPSEENKSYNYTASILRTASTFSACNVHWDLGVSKICIPFVGSVESFRSIFLSKVYHNAYDEAQGEEH